MTEINSQRPFEYPLETVVSNLGIDGLTRVLRHQNIIQNPDDFVGQPFPEDISKTHEDELSVLTKNTSRYDETVERTIAKDPLLQVLRDKQKASPRNERMDAIRARRTILAAQAILELTVEEPEIQLAPAIPHPKKNSTKHKTSTTAA